MKNKIAFIALLMFLAVSFTACSAKNDLKSSGKPVVAATTTMLADLVRQIAGDDVNVAGIMGPGVDPHLYQPTAGDVARLSSADMVVYSGLHLEGKMGEVFEKLGAQGKIVVCAADGINPERLLSWEEGAGQKDPHIWWDPSLWKEASEEVARGLSELIPDKKDEIMNNLKEYDEQLIELDLWAKKRVEEVPPESRVLITAHDAFAYFARAYGFEVRGIQGISTDAEAGAGDIDNLADYIVKKKIKAVFVESSVPKKNIEALKEAVESKHGHVRIGGELYSDSLGDEQSNTATYVETFKSNVNTVVDALK